MSDGLSAAAYAKAQAAVALAQTVENSSLQIGQNLGDLEDAAAARANLALGSAALADTDDFDASGAAAAAADASIPVSALDADAALTANSDTRVATQKAVKAYVAASAGGAATVMAASTPAATETLNLASAPNVRKTFNLSAAMTLLGFANAVAGATLELRVAQPIAGGKLLSVTDGAVTKTVPIDLTPRTITTLGISFYGPTDFVVRVLTSGIPVLDPLTIVGTGAWWDFEAAVAALATGDPLSTVEDGSPNNRDLTASLTARPLKLAAASGINGRACPRWDGSNDVMSYLGGADWASGANLTVFMLRRINANAVNAAGMSIGGVAGNDYSEAGSAVIGQQATGQGALNSYRNSAGLSTVVRPTNGTAHVETHIFDGTNHTLRLNGAAQAPVASVGAFAARRVHIGSRYFTGAIQAPYTSMDVLEAMIVPGVVSVANVDAYEQLLLEKGGLL